MKVFIEIEEESNVVQDFLNDVFFGSGLKIKTIKCLPENEVISQTFSIRVNKTDPLSVTQGKLEKLKSKIAEFISIPDFQIK